jgi:deoxyribodipyrimidine photo-lyase
VNNPATWQWMDGCGTDAAPYFRIFNRATQGRKFDSQGACVRRWAPELAGLDAAMRHGTRRCSRARRPVCGSASTIRRRSSITTTRVASARCLATLPKRR